MFLALFRAAVACALIFAIGGNWAFLQSIAWTGMVISYAKTAPLKEALEKTFDGNHPCALCKVVAEGKKSEKRHESHKLETKLDFLSCPPALPFAAPLRFCLAGFNLQFLPERIYTPPTPPPRAAKSD
jgi:hypothetical protein